MTCAPNERSRHFQYFHLFLCWGFPFINDQLYYYITKPRSFNWHVWYFFSWSSGKRRALGLPTWLSDLRCGGNESSILDCEHSGWGITYRCSSSHYDDAYVRCGVTREGNIKQQLSLPYSELFSVGSRVCWKEIFFSFSRRVYGITPHFVFHEIVFLELHSIYI